ncbi:hypothetical protein (DUF3971 domain) [Campylobacter iguaniorum]|uniref:YhdP central domain-containing protein n=1 Tax=Campylobacter iguaniorum TaxID=1244531 RepID=A0A076FAU8_9BACT|nr:AsmA-like C-terminal domain-containing protein [Campylobacter iguaniorum]AII14808.1 hypothetical protein (DUF3971 domain) [Campylobacter iguaniorum]
MRIISQIIKKMRLFIAFLVIIISTLVLTLLHGIHVDEFNSNLIYIKELYIKLDKKLIVNIKNIKINKEKNKKTSDAELLSIADNAIWINKIFKEINIQNISYDDINITMVYKDDIFFINTPYLTIDTRIYDESPLKIAVNQLNFKDFNVTLQGDLRADLAKDYYDFNGTIASYELFGDLSLKLDKEMLKYKLSNVKASSLEHFISNLAQKTGLDEEIKKWIYGYIVADDYLVEELRGKLNLKTLDYYPNELYGKARASNLVVKFHPNVTPAIAKSASVEFVDDKLIFSLNEPTYYDKSIAGSSVEIENIIGQNSNLKLHLATKSLLDSKIHEILKAYEINIPITQKSGELNSTLDLRVYFDPFKIESSGKFDLKNADILISNAPFSSKGANVILKDELISIQNANLKNEIFEADANGVIDLNQSKAEFDGEFKEICISGCEILDIKNSLQTVLLDFNQDMLITAPKLNFSMKIADQNIININDISMLKPHSKLMQSLDINGGNLEIKTTNFSDLDISLLGAKFDLPLAKISGQSYDEDDFHIKMAKNINLSSKSGLISANLDDKNLNLTLNSLKILLDSNSTDSMKYERNIHFNAKNSAVILQDLNRTINFSSFDGNLLNSELQFSGKTGDGNININKKPNSLKISGQNLSSDFANDFMGLEAFKDGNFSIRLSGVDFDTFKSEIKVQNTYLSDYKFYQRFLSFLDSIPSLLIFKVPDFNDKGFTVDNGTVLINRDANKLNIQALKLTGSSADIAGGGNIDLNSKDINIDLELKLLKDASSIISKIPLVNYIILGKDKTISTIIEVRGTLDEPKFKTEVITDILKTPYNLIKNTLELPFNLF